MKTRKSKKLLRRKTLKRGGVKRTIDEVDSPAEQSPTKRPIIRSTINRSQQVVSLSSSDVPMDGHYSNTGQPSQNVSSTLTSMTSLSSSNSTTNISKLKKVKLNSNEEEFCDHLHEIFTIDTSENFNNPIQHLLDVIGDQHIVKDFAEFNGREHTNDVLEFTRKSTLPPADFVGLAFNGAHWKGYEKQEKNQPRIVYDSYQYNIQRSSSNNFCQSYAAYLWAKRGNLGEFKPGSDNYADNIQKMSKIWLEYFDSIIKNPGMKIWLLNSINEGSKQSTHGTFTYDEIIKTLKCLAADTDKSNALRVKVSNST